MVSSILKASFRNFTQHSAVKCLPPWNGNPLQSKNILPMMPIKSLVVQQETATRESKTSGQPHQPTGGFFPSAEHFAPPQQGPYWMTGGDKCPTPTVIQKKTARRPPATSGEKAGEQIHQSLRELFCSAELFLQAATSDRRAGPSRMTGNGDRGTLGYFAHLSRSNTQNPVTSHPRPASGPAWNARPTSPLPPTATVIAPPG